VSLPILDLPYEFQVPLGPDRDIFPRWTHQRGRARCHICGHILYYDAELRVFRHPIVQEAVRCHLKHP